MARPLRIEFAGATYHVTSRGNRREPIFADDVDRLAFLDLLGHTLGRFHAAALAYCLMGNHYHLVLTTHDANLSKLMRQLGGVYTQRFNRRHDKVGHVFQGRFKAILVDRDAYLLAACRYVEQNPVRARMVGTPGEWPWSSFGAHTGAAPAPAWLDTSALQGQLLGRDVLTPIDAERAQAAYADWVAGAPGASLWPGALRQQVYLGDDAFVARMQARAAPGGLDAREVPRGQRSRPDTLTLAQRLDSGVTREEAFRRAHVEGGMTMSAIAAQSGLSVARVSQLISRAESALKLKT
jgi:REP element-mobilizing transposase RayT